MVEIIFWTLAALASAAVTGTVGLKTFAKDVSESCSDPMLWGAIGHSIVMALIAFMVCIIVITIIGRLAHIGGVLNF